MRRLLGCSARAVSSPHADYIAFPHLRVNASGAKGREGFRERLFPARSDFADTEEAEIRSHQPAGAEQGAASRIGIKSDAEQAGQLRRPCDQFAHDGRYICASVWA